LPFALVGLAGFAAVFGAGAGEVRPDHPRIFLTREMIPALKERCRSTHKDLFDRMKARCDRGEAKAIQQALCYVVTGDRRYADGAGEVAPGPRAGQIGRRDLPPGGGRRPGHGRSEYQSLQKYLQVRIA
jgi:hypothetical protein